MDKLLKDEATTFSKRIKERLHAGHIPDLRRMKPCRYFYNNVWREPYYVKLSIMPRFKFILQHIKELNIESPRVCEIGCGVGFTSLELARNGCNVIGIDISEECIKVARKFAEENPFKKGFGSLEYHVAEISNFLETKKGFFDSIVFYGVLHHFTFSELNEVCVLMRNALKKEGIVVGYEPCYDRFDQSNATVLLILKILLNITGYYYEEIQVPNNEYELMEAIRNNLMSGKQLDEEAKEKQSVRDFSSGYTDIITSLSKNFKTAAFENDHGFFELLVGGCTFQENNG